MKMSHLKLKVISGPPGMVEAEFTNWVNSTDINAIDEMTQSTAFRDRLPGASAGGEAIPILTLTFLYR